MRLVIVSLLLGLALSGFGMVAMGDREGLLIKGSSALGAALLGFAFARLVWVVWRKSHPVARDIGRR